MQVCLPEVSTAQILRDRHLEASPQFNELGERRPFGKSLYSKVRRVYAEDQRRTVADRRGIVACPGSVRRADLSQSGARLLHDVRHAEPAADLNQLAARDNHLAA